MNTVQGTWLRNWWLPITAAVVLVVGTLFRCGVEDAPAPKSQLGTTLAPSKPGDPKPKVGTTRNALTLDQNGCGLAGANRAFTPSSACLACHDGSVRGTPLGDASHPVGVYPKPTMRPPEEIVFVDGKVECTTCHDGASTLPFKLALTTDHAVLCQSCHNK